MHARRYPKNLFTLITFQKNDMILFKTQGYAIMKMAQPFSH
jgi:hypothetical protein